MNDIGTTSNNLPLRMARGLSWNFDKNGYGVQGPEKTEEEKKQETINSLPVQKELSEEEKEKLEQLKDMLTQMLASADTPPTREQKSNIRRIEKEIENLTGMKMSQSNSQVLDKMPTQDKDEEKKKKTLFAESEYLKQVQLSAISLPKNCSVTQGGAMGQVLGAFANNTIDISITSISSQILKDMKI
ncbi:hypothetical protein [Pseudodesulfovibrio senegalensis]|uniref:Uncharacterized protein n=1 Tax=Pseudodesulfovibrio senegalensis TaxID=1721087 RepID=A0A6N6N1I1_9BACT|nr:hypothetical protein [Pseudodesulfovibrio senegalensis]KAB1441229.1 hypothetical protein F8A88_12430 [Pseudodesulfovibrio senegalensis]